MPNLFLYLRQKSNIFAIALITIVFTFSQYFLLQHEHETTGYEEPEVCELCVIAQHSHGVLSHVVNIVSSVIPAVLLPLLFLSIVHVSGASRIPQIRAPPSYKTI